MFWLATLIVREVQGLWVLASRTRSVDRVLQWLLLRTSASMAQHSRAFGHSADFAWGMILFVTARQEKRTGIRRTCVAMITYGFVYHMGSSTSI